MRPGIPGSYKGLIYCSSIKEAEDVSDIINPIILRFIRNEFNLTIKRGCTEFDLVFPGYKKVDDLNKIVYDEEWAKKEELIDHEISNGSKKGKKVFNRSLSGTCLGDILIINNWLNYAKLLNDKSLSKAKILEEINELIEAVEKDTNKIHEAADILYHFMIYLEANNIKIEDIMNELGKRKK